MQLVQIAEESSVACQAEPCYVHVLPAKGAGQEFDSMCFVHGGKCADQPVRGCSYKLAPYEEVRVKLSGNPCADIMISIIQYLVADEKCRKFGNANRRLNCALCMCMFCMVAGVSPVEC